MFGKPFLFWHDQGEPYASFAPTFDKLMNRVEAWARETASSFAASDSTTFAIGTQSIGSRAAGTSIRCNTVSATPASRPRKFTSSI